jgi:hypothetical protein
MGRKSYKHEEAEESIKNIIGFVEINYGKKFPRFEKQLIEMSNEYYRCPKIFAMAEGSLIDILSERCESDKYEFIYFPDMAMGITNIAWHSDMIREFLFDLDHPKLKGVGFNDMAEEGLKIGLVGFVSSVSNYIQVNETMLTDRDKEYLGRFLKQEISND